MGAAVIAASFKEGLIETVGSTAGVYNYGNAEDFTRLWASDSSGVPGLLTDIKGKEAVIITWEASPQIEGGRAEKLLEPHLTPLDWALAFSIAAIEKNTNIPDIRIHIVDFTGKKFEGAWAIRMRHQLLAEMPWVSLYAPLVPAGEVPPFRKAYRRILESKDLKAENSKSIDSKSEGLIIRNADGWKLVQEGKSFAASVRQGRGKDLKGLAQQWAASLAQSDDHHDVNNVIGPDILAKPERRRRGLFGAFLARLEWTGHDLTAAAGWKEWNVGKPCSKHLFDLALSVYVVDDQLEQGWSRFLCRFFDGQAYDETCNPGGQGFVKLNNTKPGASKVELFGCTEPAPLIKFLETKAVFDRRDHRSQLSGNYAGPEIIFLDLRLYSRPDEAKTQARRLLGIVRKKVIPPLAWRAIEPNEIQQIQDWCDDRAINDRMADQALLLLPKLLALAMPLTPIVLFSSTGQPWIREWLKPYQNIFTGFEKPRVLSDSTSIESSLAALRDGLERAVQMMRLRLQLAHAQSTIEVATSERPPKRQRISDHHIEIYADETRDLEEGITSGLAFCVYPNPEAAGTLQKQLEVEHRNRRTVWAGLEGGGPGGLSKGSDISRDRNECQSQTERLANLLNNVQLNANSRAAWSVIATRVPAAHPATAGTVSVASFPDGPLDEALRFNLEFAIYALVPYFSGNDDFNGSVQIYLATREVPYLDRSFAQNICEAFDLGEPRYDNNKWFVASAKLTRAGNARTGSAFPLVRGWLQEWEKWSPARMSAHIRKIRMTVLGRGTINAERAKERRLFHDVADWVCTASGRLDEFGNGRNWIWPLKEQLTRKGLFSKWFVSTDSERVGRRHRYRFEIDTDNAMKLMAALKASVCGSLEDDDETDALRLLLRNSYVMNRTGRLVEGEFCAQQRVLLWMLRHEIANASGRRLHTLLAADVQRPRDLVTDGRRQVQEEGTTARPTAAEEESNIRTNIASQTALVPGIFEEVDRSARFPKHQVFIVVSTESWGEIHLKRCDDHGRAGTHQAYNKPLLLAFESDGWSEPKLVLAKESEIFGPKTVLLAAAKLADGRWKLLDNE